GAPEGPVAAGGPDQLGALGGGNNGRRLGVAPLPERLLDRPPVERREPGPDVGSNAHGIISGRETPESGGAPRRGLRALIPDHRRDCPRAVLLPTRLYGAGPRSGCT